MIQHFLRWWRRTGHVAAQAAVLQATLDELARVRAEVLELKADRQELADQLLAADGANCVYVAVLGRGARGTPLALPPNEGPGPWPTDTGAGGPWARIDWKAATSGDADEDGLFGQGAGLL